MKLNIALKIDEISETKVDVVAAGPHPHLVLCFLLLVLHLYHGI